MKEIELTKEYFKLLKDIYRTEGLGKAIKHELKATLDDIAINTSSFVHGIVGERLTHTDKDIMEQIRRQNDLEQEFRVNDIRRAEEMYAERILAAYRLYEILSSAENQNAKSRRDELINKAKKEYEGAINRANIKTYTAKIPESIQKKMDNYECRGAELAQERIEALLGR